MVGTANATSAGWGSAGGGVTQTVMPWALAAVMSLGFSPGTSWRSTMLVPATASPPAIASSASTSVSRRPAWHLACGSTYALVPFIDRKALGGVAGLVGAGGNVGAVLAGLLLKRLGDVQECFGVLGGCALVAAIGALAIRFSAEHKASEKELYERALEARRAATSPSVRAPA